MKILHSIVEYVEKEIGVSISHDGIEFKVYVKTLDGIVQGDAQHGVSTSYLSYFNVPLSVRKQHFKKIKNMLC